MPVRPDFVLLKTRAGKTWSEEHESILLNVSPISASPAQSWARLQEFPVERLFFWLSLRQLDPVLAASLPFPEVKIMSLWSDQSQSSKVSLASALLWLGIPLFYAAELLLRRELSQWTEQDLQSFLDKQSQKAPLWIRLNPSAKVEQLEVELRGAGYEWTAYGEAWLLRGGKGLQNLDCFQKGWLEIQDRASQEIGRAVAARPGQQIWDCCAGGGGKTLQIAAQLTKAGSVFASDVRAYKLSELERRAERAGLKNIYSLAFNGEKLPVLPKTVQKAGGFDTILIDAPCSATGTWRRSPDARYRVEPKSILDLQKIQKGLFQVVLPALKPGGRLVYASCSWLPAENEVVIRAALQQFPELELLSMHTTGCPGQDSDTMFVAVLQNR
ncbi:MAG: RsmB/NOP family class I SAM-dependent RNA methyltransferase [Proteobacteria bacterium]|nr:RsmB/NOP family class I SAM-dependent RNA methyltransferase [Pseudomonadota bacterium]